MDNDRNQKAKESKPRLRWSFELHHRFIDAVDKLGGPEKATPKALMMILETPELTLYHLKSHLQKYRLGKSERFVGNKQEETQEAQSQNDSRDQPNIIATEEKDYQPNENLQIKEALEIQVQKKLHEQIEVRIEAQGKYLQSVLMKAQETLFGYTSSNLGINFARSELYGVASIEKRSCLSSSFSELTQAEEVGEEVEEKEGFLGYKKPENRGIRQTRISVDSSLTSPESLEAETVNDYQSVMRRSMELQLMELKPEEVMERKKRRLDDAVSMERPIRKRAFGSHQGKDLGLSLNSFRQM